MQHETALIIDHISKRTEINLTAKTIISTSCSKYEVLSLIQYALTKNY